jgi:hypothetical protein
MPAQIQDLIRLLREFGCRPDLLDETVPNKKTTIGNFPPVVVHRD